MALMSGLLLALTVGNLLMVFMVPVVVGFANSAFMVIYANTTSLVLDQVPVHPDQSYLSHHPNTARNSAVHMVLVWDRKVWCKN